MARKLSSKRERQLVKAARKKLKKKGAKNRASAGKVKIQTVSPWKRGLVGMLSFLFLWGSFYFYEESTVVASVFAVLFLVTAFIAVMGCRKTIDSALNGLDSAVSDRVIGSIFDGLF